MRTDGRPLHTRLALDEPVAMFWSMTGSPAVIEMAAEAGTDTIVLDLQHGLWDRTSVEWAIGAVRGRADVIARVADASDAGIGMALDAGADGVMVPLVESAATAASVVAAAHYPPRGRRSGGGLRPLAHPQAYIERSRAETVVMVMIETAAGVAAADAIAAVPGVDMVFIGGGDLALSLGIDRGVDRSVLEDAYARIFAACRRAGRPCGIFTLKIDEAIARRAAGYGAVVIANDMSLVRDGLAAVLARFAPT